MTSSQEQQDSADGSAVVHSKERGVRAWSRWYAACSISHLISARFTYPLWCGERVVVSNCDAVEASNGELTLDCARMFVCVSSYQFLNGRVPNIIFILKKSMVRRTVLIVASPRPAVHPCRDESALWRVVHDQFLIAPRSFSIEFCAHTRARSATCSPVKIMW